MLDSLRKIKFNYVKVFLSKYNKYKVPCQRNGYFISRIPCNKYNLVRFTTSDRFSYRCLPQKIGYLALITAFCFAKKDGEKCKENTQLDDFDEKNKSAEKHEHNVKLDKNEEKCIKSDENLGKKMETRHEELDGENKFVNGNKRCDEETQSGDEKKIHLESGSRKADMMQTGEKSSEIANKCRGIENHDSLFMEAAKQGDIDEIKRLLQEGIDVNQRHSFGWTALHVAAINRQFRVVAELLSKGADPNLGDNFSSLKEIAWEKQLKDEEVAVVRQQEFYPKMKMNVNCRNRTALHYAVYRQDFDTVKLLLRYGADPTALSESGISPFDLANSSELKDLLRTYMENKDEEEIMRLHSYVKRLINKGYSVNVSTAEKEHGEKSDTIGPVKLQVRNIHTNELIKEVNFSIRLKKKFITV